MCGLTLNVYRPCVKLTRGSWGGQCIRARFLRSRGYGATASASLAVGLGANVLVGGLDKSFALQPISLQTQRGVNFALAVAQLELRSIEQAESER